MQYLERHRLVGLDRIGERGTGASRYEVVELLGRLEIFVVWVRLA